MLRYAITDRHLFPGSEADRQCALIAQARRLADSGVDYLQLREKDLPFADLLKLATTIRDTIAQQHSRMRLIVNGNAEVARRAELCLHVPASQMAAAGEQKITSISCHTLAEIALFRHRAELLLFAPVFGKQLGGIQLRPVGLDALAAACREAMGTPVLALGGVTAQNAAACVAAGAAGAAGIRLFLHEETFASPAETF